MTARREPTRNVKRVGLSRRDLLKAAQVAGAATALGSAVLAGRQLSAETRTRSRCRLCTMHCGVVAHVRGDTLVRMEGDPDSPTRGFICGNGAALPEIVHSHERLRMPLRRVGNTFEEVPWDVALAEVAASMTALRQRHGARAMAVQTGWPFVRHPLVPLLHRFMRAFGSPNVATVASLCEATGRMARAFTFGANAWPDAQNARTLFAWGANPAHSAPPLAHLFAQATRRGRHLVVVDPVRTELASIASVHLQLRPGTDGALALGMVNLVLQRAWFDAAWVEANTTGLEALRASAARWPLERVVQETGLDAASVERATQWFAQEGPTATWEGLGLEHHAQGFQTVRALSCLQALCGCVDVKGGMTLHDRVGPDHARRALPAQFTLRTPEPVPPEVSELAIGHHAFPVFEACNRQAQSNLFARAILEDNPYPLRGLMLIGSNTLLTGPGSLETARAAEKLDLLVVVDPFLSRSAERADFVLPATTFAESPNVLADDAARAEDLGMVPPQHGARPDWRIVFDLAHALGLGEYFPWTSLRHALAQPQVPFMPPTADHALLPDPSVASPVFPTRSGKVEFHSSTLERLGAPAVPSVEPMPSRSADFPLVLVSGPRTRPYINSQFRRVPALARKMDHATARLHPHTASGLSLTEGTRVKVSTAHGVLELPLSVDDTVHVDAVVVPYGWADADVNVLTSLDGLDPVTGFPVLRSVPCRVQRA